jgi:acyl-CoA reductase-like NAD-dependent aldehyde dehydrogenase
MAIESINPANNKLLRRFDPLTDDAARQKIALADDAFCSYGNVPLEHRALCMRKLAAILEHETDDLATLITLETRIERPAVRPRNRIAGSSRGLPTRHLPDAPA